MSYSALPAAGLIAAILALIPLPRQIRARNIATIALSWWFFGSCLILAVDAIIWAGNVNNSAPVWCDISARFLIATNFGLPGATFCVSRQLESASSGRPITPDTDRRRRIIFEVVMGFIMPCFWVFVVYCFQSSRFVITENLYCTLQFFPSELATVIFVVPLLMLMVGTLIYGCVALYHLVRHRRTSAALLGLHLKSRNSSLSSTQYYRLMATTMVLGLWGTGWILFLLVIDIKYDNNPLPSWRVVHSSDSDVYAFPTSSLTPDIISINLALWWAFPSAAYVFFLLFATNREVISDYQKVWVWFRTRVLGQIVQTNSMLTIRTGSVITSTVTIGMTTLGDEKSEFPEEP